MSRLEILQDRSELATGRPYPERSGSEPGLHDRVAEFLVASTVRPLRNWLHDPARTLRQILPHVDRHESALRVASDEDLLIRTRSLKTRLRREGVIPEIVGEGFALVREAAGRTLGQRHFPSQLLAGWALLQGKLIEMETGEGKTMAATLPASIMGLAGYPVHVITDLRPPRDRRPPGCNPLQILSNSGRSGGILSAIGADFGPITRWWCRGVVSRAGTAILVPKTAPEPVFWRSFGRRDATW